MIIAVPTTNGEIDPHFGKAREFTLFYTDEFDDIAKTEVLAAPGTGYRNILPVLRKKGVQVIICGKIGAYAVLAVRAAKIMLLGGADGKAENRVKDFLGGTLRFYMPGEPVAPAPVPGEDPGEGDGIETDGNIAACGDSPVCTG